MYQINRCCDFHSFGEFCLVYFDKCISTNAHILRKQGKGLFSNIREFPERDSFLIKPDYIEMKRFSTA